MNAIENAVLPLKSEAVQRAEQEAQRMIDRIIAELEAAGWNLDVVAPQPNTRMGRNEYVQMRAHRDLFTSVTTYTQTSRRPSEPDIRARSPEAEQRFIDEAKKDAAFQYDLFVAKLVKKVGETTDATLVGSHVWGHSILTVTLLDGSVQKWKTQMIVNVSKLGKLFNQFPTRIVK